MAKTAACAFRGVKRWNRKAYGLLTTRFRIEKKVAVGLFDIAVKKERMLRGTPC
jgi:hypothetical protein